MELLAVAGIALWGYYVGATNPKWTRPGSGPGPDDDEHTPDVVDDQIQDIPPTAMVEQYIEDSEKRWDDSRIPKQSGIITPYTRPSEIMPFFKSAKTQNTNTQVKQRKLELFSGNLLEDTSLTGTWKRKVEAPAMFAPTPQGIVTSGGTTGNPIGEAAMEKARAVQSTKHNNVLPAEQIRVGPGLGVGPDVAATGGFQQFYRQLPLNVNDYKLTTLPGRANHGASRIAKPEAPQHVQVNHNPGATVINYDDRPPEPTLGAYRAQSLYPADPAREFQAKKMMETNREGIATGAHEAPQARHVDDTRGRTKNGYDPTGNVGGGGGVDHEMSSGSGTTGATGDGRSDPAINRAYASTIAGSYVVVNGQLSQKHTSQRESGVRTIGTGGMQTTAGPSLPVSTGETRPILVPQTTIRELTGYTGDHLGIAGVRNPVEPMNAIEHQDLTRYAKRAEQNIGGYMMPAGVRNPVEPMNAIEHQDLTRYAKRAEQNIGGYMMPAGLANPANRTDVAVHQPLTRHAKRADQTRGLVNPAGRVNAFQNSSLGTTGVRKSHAYYAGLSHTQAKLPNQVVTGTAGVPVRAGSKQDPWNRWLDTSIAERQLSGNPYAHDISSTIAAKNAAHAAASRVAATTGKHVFKPPSAAAAGAGRPLPQDHVVSKQWRPTHRGPQVDPLWFRKKNNVKNTKKNTRTT